VATGADWPGFRILFFSGPGPDVLFRHFQAAIFASQTGLSFADRKKRNEKKAEVVVNPGPVEGSRAAAGADSRLLVQFFYPRGYSSN